MTVVAVSNDDQATSKKTQEMMPHLVIVSDKEQNVAKAMQLIHPGMSHDGGDTNVPATFIVDGAGSVVWAFHPHRFTDRPHPDEVLAAIDHSGKGR